MANGGPITPGREPENIKKLLDVFLADLDKAYPDGVVVWNEWNHEKWDKVAGFLCKNLGYTKGADFLQAYGFEIVQERKPESKPVNKKEKEPKSIEKPVNKSAKQWQDEDYKPRKKKNHTLLIVSIVVLILALMAVGVTLFIMNRSNNGEAISPISAPKKNEDGPEKTVNQFCDAMKAFDLEKMHSLVIEDGEALLDTSDNMAQTFMESLKEWAGKLSYNITDTAINGDKADVTVKFKYTDATNLIKNTLAEYMTQAFAMVFDNPSEDELQSLLGKVFQEQKGKITVGTAEASVVFPCSKTADGWKIDRVSDETLSVLTGNMLKVFDEFGELNFDEA